MELSGGGWTLVYSYGFSRYQASNLLQAVTPRPSWTATLCISFINLYTLSLAQYSFVPHVTI